MKFYSYTVILIGIIILFNAIGLNTATGSGGLLSSGYMFRSLYDVNTGTFTIQNIVTSSLWVKILAIFSLAGVAGVVVGTFSRAPPANYLIAAVVSLIAGYIISDLVSIFIYINSLGEAWVTWIALAIIGPLLYGFFISAIEFWQGYD